MERYDLIKGLNEAFEPLYQEIENLRTDIMTKGTEYVSVDFGGSLTNDVISVNYRFKVHSDSISFKLIDDSSVYDYSIYFGTSTKNVISYSDSWNVQIEYGLVADRSIIRLIDIVEGTSRVERSMYFPIQESQYFQLLTVQELASEEFYNYLVNTNTDYMIGVQLNDKANSVRTLGNILYNELTIKQIIFNVKLLIGVYRNTHKV